jgi:hypothetical protein
MRKLVLLCAISLCAFTTKSNNTDTDPNDVKHFPSLLANSTEPAAANSLVDSLYTSIHLEGAGLSHDAFFKAYKGYQYLLSKGKLLKKELLTICDFTQSSSQKRLYVIDLAAGKLLFNTFVAHGHNSGNTMATSFSNINSSNKSSEGFLVTAETYVGHNGYSMRFDGMEKDFNGNVRMRDVVMHGSDYVNAQRAADGSMMGRSWGCPAVPRAECKSIIDGIKGGSCFFIYTNDPTYAHSSPILNARFEWPFLAMQTPSIPEVTVAPAVN